jgi:protein SCO1/2
MQTTDPIRGMTRGGILCRSGMLSAMCALAVMMFAVPAARAQVAPYGEKTMGDPAQDHLPDILERIKITQRLNQQLPLNAPFVDSEGRQVTLGDYFGKGPVILALVYYQCPILCSEELSGLVSALEMVDLKPGKDFEIVVASIDPTEGPALARAQRAMYVARYHRPSGAAGWHFLTGPEPSIKALADAVGFHYVSAPGPDGKLNQFSHSTSLEVITPEGRVAQYYMGVEYSPEDLTLGLVEASHHKIGTVVENLMTYCYRYDPQVNRRSLMLARLTQLACLMTVFGVGSFMVVNFRRDIKQTASTRAATTRADQSDKG